MDPDRLLPAAELRLIHERLAHRGVLLGQPVNLGRFGGLRIAISARDMPEGQGDDELERIFAGLGEMTLPPRRIGCDEPVIRV